MNASNSARTASNAGWWERPAPRLAEFGTALVVLFGGGWGLGALTGPETAPQAVGAQHAISAPSLVSPDAHSGGHGSAHPVGPEPHGAAATTDGASGLRVTQDGYTLETLAAPTAAGVPGELVFRILGPNGAPVTAFTPTHDKALHLIVVRRDQSGFQHLHPVMDPSGVWRTPITLVAGDHRLLADFAPDGRSDGLTLGRDLPIAGDYRPVALPAPSTTATTPDGYTVTLTGALTAGTSSPLQLSVSKGGTPVTDLEPYLAAYGHLVALRTGDLAYLHVHPEGHPGDGRTPAGPDIGFAAEVPTPGPYRLYLDFAHHGLVRTVEFTALAGPATGSSAATAPAPVAETAPAPVPGVGAGHVPGPAAPAHDH